MPPAADRQPLQPAPGMQRVPSVVLNGHAQPNAELVESPYAEHPSSAFEEDGVLLPSPAGCREMQQLVNAAVQRLRTWESLSTQPLVLELQMSAAAKSASANEAAQEAQDVDRQPSTVAAAKTVHQQRCASPEESISLLSEHSSMGHVLEELPDSVRTFTAPTFTNPFALQGLEHSREPQLSMEPEHSQQSAEEGLCEVSTPHVHYQPEQQEPHIGSKTATGLPSKATEARRAAGLRTARGRGPPVSAAGSTASSQLNLRTPDVSRERRRRLASSTSACLHTA
jgi:hypothetical protein